MCRGRRCPCAGPQPFAEADACGPAAGFPFSCLEFTKKMPGRMRNRWLFRLRSGFFILLFYGR